ncbi:MAG: UvrD-helicase domain-containing protein [Betaproteobacteria bacterium]|nr:UvrD-helicase domain-containing protein [Betaproteobacteria bacterium]
MRAADRAARAAALDPAHSCIVQAPAGSGKTELLIQRYLRLLATVAEPEDVVAMTFTRKAAGEMKERVLKALAGADSPPPTAEHERLTWTLARELAAHAARCNWELGAHPSRLAIQTIDAWCAKLTRAAPLSAGLGLIAGVAEDAGALYTEAARRTVLAQPMPPPVERLLAHLDNRIDRLIGLIANMLAHRDQWLPWLVRAARQPDLRAALERDWRVAIEHELAAADTAYPPQLRSPLLALMAYAADNLAAAAKADPAPPVPGLPADWPGATAADAAQWSAIASLLLTKGGTLRRQVTAAQGFPAPSGAKGEEKARREHYKGAMGDLLAALEDQPGFLVPWTRLQGLPSASYTEVQWEAIAALLAALPLAAAHLRLVFAANDRTDFVAVALAALQVLGDETAPSDLLLAYDQRIAHVLIDEFQDTSLSQFGLISRLTAGWSEGDGRTLFAVGDPMQSVYRFRGAEVGLFLDAQTHGLNGMPLQPLRLRVNFRSRAPLVDWVNRVFAQVLPAADKPEEGAASFVSAVAADAGEPGPGAAGAVGLHAEADAAAQAATVVKLVRDARLARPEGSIAILVRARSHLRDIVPALRGAGLAWQAIDIDPLAAKQTIVDCLALTHALLEPADRLAWLAVLRAPWCGLSLADLTHLVDGLGAAPVLTRMGPGADWRRLSPDGQARLARCAPLLAAATERAARGPLAQAAEHAWLRLGGPATLADPADVADVERYWRLLGAHSVQPAFDWAELESAVDRLFGEAAPGAGAGPPLQIMTMHRAKGLEFDTVLVPGLTQGSGRSDPPLLRWRAGQAATGQRTLLLAPIQEQGQGGDTQYDYLQRRSQAEERHELARLLYVAATRAKQTLHWLAVIPPAGDDYKPPAASALALLWPALAAEWPRPAAAPPAPGAEDHSQPPQSLRRLAPDWQPPLFTDLRPAAPAAPASAAAPAVAYDWAQDTARAVGIVAHEWLRRIGDEGLTAWDRARLDRAQGLLRIALAEEGVPPAEIDGALQRVVLALANLVDSARGRWIFAPEHAHAHSEFALTASDDGQLARIVVDRSFVDAGGVRWIVDFKTSQHGGTDLEAFLDNEVGRHRAQLERYARLWSAFERRPLRLGLYWPLHDAWREWAHEDAPAPVNNAAAPGRIG